MAENLGILERLFHIRAKGSTVKTELLAGLTTYVAVAYIIFVNPSILSDAGIPKEAAIAATIWSTVIATTLLGMLTGVCPAPTGLSSLVSASLPDIGPILFKLDIAGALEYGLISIIFSFTVVELFDNMGTLIALSRKAGMMDEKGHIENLDRALMTDSVGTLASSLLGTSTVTTYIEGAAGIAQGGRTGLTALTVAALFVLSIFFAPFVALVPAFATAPALVIVGGLMMSEARNINFADFTDGLPAFLTIIMMPLTYSIASGFAFGFVSYVLLKLLTGRVREVSVVMWLIAGVFMINFAMHG